jgi:putative endonuclease
MTSGGQHGERLAARYLLRRGWRILARNWHGGGGEIDLVAARGGVVAFVEVKARGDPAALDDPVTPAQRMRLIRAASAFLACHPELDRAWARFDLIAVDTGARPGRRLRHVAAAFDAPAGAGGPTSKSRSSGYASDRKERR